MGANWGKLWLTGIDNQTVTLTDITTYYNILNIKWLTADEKYLNAHIKKKFMDISIHVHMYVCGVYVYIN